MHPSIPACSRSSKWLLIRYSGHILKSAYIRKHSPTEALRARKNDSRADILNYGASYTTVGLGPHGAHLLAILPNLFMLHKTHYWLKISVYGMRFFFYYLWDVWVFFFRVNCVYGGWYLRGTTHKRRVDSTQLVKLSPLMDALHESSSSSKFVLFIHRKTVAFIKA